MYVTEVVQSAIKNEIGILLLWNLTLCIVIIKCDDQIEVPIRTIEKGYGLSFPND